MGWHCDYVCRILSTYHQYTLDKVLYDLPMMQGFVLYSWAYANCPIHMFNGIQMVDGGYMGQEADNLLLELKEMLNKSK